MLFGFTYNGVHSSEFGLYYTRTPEEKWFKDAEYDVYDTDIDWRHGGVYYASKAKVRTFTLKCYFEEITLDKRQAIKNWLHRDSSGSLIFDEMPFVYWNVRPGKIPVGNWYLDIDEKNSGVVTITFNAYEPFGYLTRKYNTVQNPTDNSDMYCNFLYVDDMPDEPTANSTQFDIYNPGTEACGMTIELAGTTNNRFRFFNETNGTYCEFGSIPGNNMRLEINGDTGYVDVHMANSSEKGNGFAYHNKGVVRLEPNAGKSNVSYINGEQNGTEYKMDLVGYPVTSLLKGASVKLSNGAVLTVATVNSATNRIWCTTSGSITFPATGICSIETVNKIKIQEYNNNSWVTPSGSTTLSLSYLRVDYNPRAL